MTPGYTNIFVPGGATSITGIVLTDCSLVDDGIAHFIRTKYRAMARTKGYLHAAKLLRKQGWPLHLAREILL